jgi:hypothetical protein
MIGATGSRAARVATARVQRQAGRRDYGRKVGLALHLGGDVGKDEELAPRVRPAERAGNGAGSAPWLEQLVVPGMGVGLQDAAKAGEMITWMLAAPIT